MNLFLAFSTNDMDKAKNKTLKFVSSEILISIVLDSIFNQNP